MSAGWQDDAACAEVGGELWFPTLEKQTGPLAKKICATCPVQADCLEFALVNDIDHGIYGGRTAKERAALKREAA